MPPHCFRRDYWITKHYHDRSCSPLLWDDASLRWEESGISSYPVRSYSSYENIVIVAYKKEEIERYESLKAIFEQTIPI